MTSVFDPNSEESSEGARSRTIIYFFRRFSEASSRSLPFPLPIAVLFPRNIGETEFYRLLQNGP